MGIFLDFWTECITGRSLSLGRACFLPILRFFMLLDDSFLCALCVLVPQFVEKAPKDIVRGVQEKAAEAEEKINLTKNRLAFLKSTVLVTK